MTKITIDIEQSIYQRIEIKRAQDGIANKNIIINKIIEKYFELFPGEGVHRDVNMDLTNL